jgi:hypothetical protein
MYAQHRKGAWSKAAAWGYAIFAYRDNVGQQKFRNSELCSLEDSLFLGQRELSKGFRVEQVPVKN